MALGTGAGAGSIHSMATQLPLSVQALAATVTTQYQFAVTVRFPGSAR